MKKNVTVVDMREPTGSARVKSIPCWSYFMWNDNLYMKFARPDGKHGALHVKEVRETFFEPMEVVFPVKVEIHITE